MRFAITPNYLPVTAYFKDFAVLIHQLMKEFDHYYLNLQNFLYYLLMVLLDLDYHY